MLVFEKFDLHSFAIGQRFTYSRSFFQQTTARDSRHYTPIFAEGSIAKKVPQGKGGRHLSHEEEKVAGTFLAFLFVSPIRLLARHFFAAASGNLPDRSQKSRSALTLGIVQDASVPAGTLSTSHPTGERPPSPFCSRPDTQPTRYAAGKDLA